MLGLSTKAFRGSGVDSFCLQEGNLSTPFIVIENDFMMSISVLFILHVTRLSKISISENKYL